MPGADLPPLSGILPALVGYALRLSRNHGGEAPADALAHEAGDYMGEHWLVTFAELGPQAWPASKISPQLSEVRGIARPVDGDIQGRSAAILQRGNV